MTKRRAPPRSPWRLSTRSKPYEGSSITSMNTNKLKRSPVSSAPATPPARISTNDAIDGLRAARLAIMYWKLTTARIDVTVKTSEAKRSATNGMEIPPGHNATWCAITVPSAVSTTSSTAPASIATSDTMPSTLRTVCWRGSASRIPPTNSGAPANIGRSNETTSVMSELPRPRRPGRRASGCRVRCRRRGGRSPRMSP